MIRDLVDHVLERAELLAAKRLEAGVQHRRARLDQGERIVGHVQRIAWGVARAVDLVEELVRSGELRFAVRWSRVAPVDRRCTVCGDPAVDASPAAAPRCALHAGRSS